MKRTLFSNFQECLLGAKLNDANLTEAMATLDMTQNLSKKKMVPSIVGDGRMALVREAA